MSTPRRSCVRRVSWNTPCTNGPFIDKKYLGLTLTHEHLSADFSLLYRHQPRGEFAFWNDETKDISLSNIGFIKQYPYSFKKNLSLGQPDLEVLKSELGFFKAGGGCTIVENSSYGLNRNEGFIRELEKYADVNIIIGTGHYVEDCQDFSTRSKSVEQLASMYIYDINRYCGFIGEVGSNWPITDFEKKAIQAAAKAQSSTKVAVSFHPGPHPDAPAEIIRIFAEAGGDLSRAAMSHLDRTLNLEQLLEFSNVGTYCQLDSFGTEASHYHFSPETDMPSDDQRIRLIQALIEEKKLDRILISHDIHTKHRLTAFGGHGYCHIPINVRPQMLQKGISCKAIQQITVTNPADWLCGPDP